MNIRNLVVLTVSQALALCGSAMVVLLGGVIGSRMAPSPALATLPVTALVVGVALFAVPAALIMKRIGRRLGFVLAMGAATLAALGAAYSVWVGNYLLLCAAMLFIGGNLAFAQQYRFAAVESAEPRYAGRAVAFIFLGGVFSGVLGPQLANAASEMMTVTYAGSFVALAGLYAVATVGLLFFRNPQVRFKASPATELPERPLRSIVTQRSYLVAVWAGLVASGVMGFIMTAAPVSLRLIDVRSAGETALVVQSHIVSMYLPSLFTGILIGWMGSVRMKLAGAASMAAAIGVALLGHNLVNYIVALVLLGIGWNFLFVGATVLLTQTYRPSERFKAQAANDLMVFSVSALATLAAGPAILGTSWEWVNLMALPLLAATFVLVGATCRGAGVRACPPTVAPY